MGADHWDGIVPPQSTCAVRMEMRKQQHPPQNMDQFRIFMGTKDILQHLIYADLSKHASTRDEVLRQVREDGGKAYEVSLMSVICDPEQESEIIRLNKVKLYIWQILPFCFFFLYIFLGSNSCMT